LLTLLTIVSSVSAAKAEQHRSSRFDYWLLALSWSPQYCATTQQAASSQCGVKKSYGFVVHGLWPQYERGYPSYCGTPTKLKTGLIERLLPIMPSQGLIEHAWRKHGSCSGLDADDYFGHLEQGYSRLRVPEKYRSISEPLSQSAQELERRWISANPALNEKAIALQCSGRYLSEVRICFDLQFEPRNCGDLVRDRCPAQIVLRPQR
jgi:ribonuclease T2